MGETTLKPRDEMPFRQAVSELALLQARKISHSWDPGQRDCAGLIRFAYREALMARTLSQRQRLSLPPEVRFPPVSSEARSSLRDWPRLWWVSARGSFAYFADAPTLIQDNFRFLGKDPYLAKPGDLFVFTPKDDLGAFGFHLMLFTGGAMDGGSLVYHNGAEGPAAEVRIVTLGELMRTSLSRWRPESSNPHFKGVYQWRRLRPVGAS